MSIDVTRRTLLRATLAAAGASALGLQLAGCSNEGRGGGTAGPQQVDASLLPTYIPYEGVEPDVRGDHGVADAFFAYPATPVKGVESPPGDGEPIRTMGITNTPIPPGQDNNLFWQTLNERVGSPVEINLSNPSDYNQKFPTAVAGNQLPDIWSVGAAPQRPQLLEAEALDLTPYLSGGAVEAYPFLANIPTDSWRSTVFNGKIFAVPVPRGVISTQIMYARDDLLAAHGITEPPGSYEDFVDICAEVTAPAANTWAMSRVPLDYVRQMYEIPNAWHLVDGQLTSAYEHEAQKDALESCRRLVDAGYVNPDTFTTQFQNYQVWFANGTTLFTIGTFSAWPGYYQLRSAGQESFSLTAYGPPKFEGGGPASAWLGPPTNSITALNKDAGDRVETLLSFLNYLAAPFGTEEYLFVKYGLPDVHHTLDGADPILTDTGRSELQMGLLYLADAPWPIYQPGLPDETQKQYDAQMAIVPDAVPNPTLGLYSETDSRRGGQLASDINNLQNDIMQGRQPVSAWDDAVAQWKADGGDAIRDEFQQALDEAPEG